jgi:hypothetical protein
MHPNTRNQGFGRGRVPALNLGQELFGFSCLYAPLLGRPASFIAAALVEFGEGEE